MIDKGYCEEWGCDRVYGEDECNYAATQIPGCLDKTPSEAKRDDTPAGCYYRPDFKTLWYNFYSRGPAETARQVLCYCPNDYASKYEPNPTNFGGEDTVITAAAPSG